MFHNVCVNLAHMFWPQSVLKCTTFSCSFFVVLEIRSGTISNNMNHSLIQFQLNLLPEKYKTNLDCKTYQSYGETCSDSTCLFSPKPKHLDTNNGWQVTTIFCCVNDCKFTRPRHQDKFLNDSEKHKIYDFYSNCTNTGWC